MRTGKAAATYLENTLWQPSRHGWLDLLGVGVGDVAVMSEQINAVIDCDEHEKRHGSV